MGKKAAPASRPASGPYSVAYAGTHLLDVNVLIALASPLHVHHVQAHAWFESVGQKSWATCPLTQLAFVRNSANPKIISAAVSPRTTTQTLSKMTALPCLALFFGLMIRM